MAAPSTGHSNSWTATFFLMATTDAPSNTPNKAITCSGNLSVQIGSPAMNKETAQPAGLISVLLDKSAPLGDRDDAAMDLEAFDDHTVQSALLEVLLNLEEDDGLVTTAAESYGQIWANSGRSKFDAPLDEMHPAAKAYFRDHCS